MELGFVWTLKTIYAGTLFLSLVMAILRKKY